MAKASKGSNDKSQHGVESEAKLPEGTLTTTLGFEKSTKNCDVYSSASGPIRSQYISKGAFGEGGRPDSVTLFIVPNRTA